MVRFVCGMCTQLVMTTIQVDHQYDKEDDMSTVCGNLKRQCELGLWCMDNNMGAMDDLGDNDIGAICHVQLLSHCSSCFVI